MLNGEDGMKCISLANMPHSLALSTCLENKAEKGIGMYQCGAHFAGNDVPQLLDFKIFW